MTLAVALVLLILLASVLLYVSEYLSIESTSLLLIGALLVAFQLVPVPDAAGRNILSTTALLHGFSDPGLIALLCLLVLGHGVSGTGVLGPVAGAAVRGGGGTLWRSLAIVLLMVTLVSGVVNNTPLVVLFVPLLQKMAEQLGQSPRRVLIPLSYAGILGGRMTLIGSSLNLLVAGQYARITGEELGFFVVTLPGLVVAAAGLVYCVFVAPWLLAPRAGDGDGGGEERAPLYIGEVTIGADSRAIGKPVEESRVESLPDLRIRMIRRNNATLVAPFNAVALQADDTLVVFGERAALVDAIRDDTHLAPHDYPEDDPEDEDTNDNGKAPAAEIAPLPTPEAPPEKSEKSGKPEKPDPDTALEVLGEVIIPPQSDLIGSTLRHADFGHRFNLSVIAMRMRQRSTHGRIIDRRLEVGDILLVRGTRAAAIAAQGGDLMPIAASVEELPRPHHAWQAITIMGAVVGSAATGLLPIAVAAFLGVLAMMATGILTLRQAVSSLDTKVILLVAAAAALATAIEGTGAAAMAASSTATLLAGLGPFWVLAAFFVVVTICTNLLSNYTCGLVFAPVAIGLAHSLGLAPEIFAVALIFAASNAYATPMGYQTNLLVMAAGRYRFNDYVLAGLPMIALVTVVYLAYVAVFVDLTPG